jgi:hypothetical protein
MFSYFTISNSILIVRFIQNTVVLLASQGLLITLNLTVGAQTVSVITTDRYQFYSTFNENTTLTIPQLNTMNCLIQDPFSTPVYSDFITQDSGWWYGYILGGFGSFGKHFLI